MAKSEPWNEASPIAFRRGVLAGALLCLEHLYVREHGVSVEYDELVRRFGATALIGEARRSGNMRATGMSRWLRENGND